MCYSALVKQELHNLARKFGAEIAWEMFADVFRRRLEQGDVKLSRALENNFDQPGTDVERRIKGYIDEYRTQCASKWEQELFAQKRRLADAERSLSKKETKKAREDVRIATDKIDTRMEWLADLKRTEIKEKDERIFPMVTAPVVANVDGRLQVVPMRYTCRLGGKPANYDQRYPGTYNARRDNLKGFWGSVFGKKHAVVVVDQFFENVPLHLFEHRELGHDEKLRNVVLRFNPQPAASMLVACLWDHWTEAGAPDLYSFAAITDEPPPEISATGHQRCIISLRESNIAEWLSPARASDARLDEILGDKERPYYEHRIAA